MFNDSDVNRILERQQQQGLVSMYVLLHYVDVDEDLGDVLPAVQRRRLKEMINDLRGKRAGQ